MRKQPVLGGYPNPSQNRAGLQASSLPENWCLSAIVRNVSWSCNVELGQEWLLFCFVWTVNCSSTGVFAFSVCLSWFNNSAGNYMRHEVLMMDQKNWALLADVLFCFWIYQSHYAVPSTNEMAGPTIALYSLITSVPWMIQEIRNVWSSFS